MTAFDNIKTNNWPSASNEFEDFLVLKLPLNDQASLTESLPVVAGSKLLFPKRTLTNTGVSSEARAISSHALTFRGAASPTAHLSNNTQTPGTWWYNTDHYDSNDVANTSFADWVFDPPLDDVTSIEVDSRHDSQYFNPYYYQVYDENDAALVASPADKTGTGQGNYTSIYSGSATKVKRIKQYGGGGIDDFYGIKINGTILNQSNGISGLSGSGTQATATYSIGGSPGKHYDNNATFNGSSTLLLSNSGINLGGDYCVECYFRPSGSIGEHTRIFECQPANFAFYIYGSNNSTYVQVGGGSSLSGGANTWTINTWHHFATTRQDGVTRLFIDGVQKGSSGSSTAALNLGTTINLNGDASGNYRWSGAMQDFRIYNGVAKYTANFTPPSAILS
jgi:hypothetical protein